MLDIARPMGPLGRGRMALALLVLLGGSASPLFAQLLPRRSAPCPNPYFPCPPGYALPPGYDPTKPPPPVLGPDGKPLPPDQQPPPTPAPQPEDTSSSLTSQVTSAPAARSANMFGDLFGGQPIRIPTNALMGGGSSAGILNGQQLIGAVGVGSTAGPTILVDYNTGVLVLPAALAPPGTPSVIPFTSVGISGTDNEPLPPAVGSKAGQINQILQFLAAPPGTPMPTPPGLSAAQQGLLRTAAQAAEGRPLTQFSLQNVVTQLAPPAPRVLGAGNEYQYASTILSFVQGPGAFPVAEILVPNPSNGGVVGLVKIAEDNSPLPRDRIIFNYDYFNNVPFTAGGLPVSRYQFGFEKTFFSGRASFEARLPFATTLTSTSTIGGETRGAELGNLRFALKGLLLRGSKVNLATGFAFTLPTADDTVILNADGSTFLRVNNNSVQLSPYLALLYTPNARLFAQAWYGFTFDTGGNTVYVDPTFFGVADPRVGSLRGAPLMQADLQLGYWIYNSQSGLIRGLAPFVELHYAGAAGSPGSVTAGPVQIGQIGFQDQLNMSAGVTTILAQNATLSVGAATPLLSTPNRTFDYQIGVRFNYFFGYTARTRSASMMASSFGY